MINPVIYHQDFFDATEYYRSTLTGNTKDFNNLFGMYPTISKGTEWAYEKEWRVIIPYGPNAPRDFRQLSMPTPTRILLGARISEDNSDKILEIAKSKRIAVHRMLMSKERFSLYSEPIYLP